MGYEKNNKLEPLVFQGKVVYPMSDADILDELNDVEADRNYQTPTIVGSQIQLKKMETSSGKLFFKLNSDFSGNATISLNGGLTSKPLNNIDGSQVTTLKAGFVEVIEAPSFFTYAPKGGTTIDAAVTMAYTASSSIIEYNIPMQTVNSVSTLPALPTESETAV